jgi:hypothetical protein
VSTDGKIINIEVFAKRTPKTVKWTVRVTNPDGATAVKEDGLTVLP